MTTYWPRDNVQEDVSCVEISGEKWHIPVPRVSVDHEGNSNANDVLQVCGLYVAGVSALKVP